MYQDSCETFTEEQKKTLQPFVTNTTGPVFVLRNLPEVIKGALFSRYSRSNLGLRSLLLKEFIVNPEEAGFHTMIGTPPSEQTLSIQKAQSFYDRILDGYGDDSIGELGGAHLAIENLSMLGAKLLEDCRIGGSPLEKSTRYIYFDKKINGEYLFYKEPILMTSAYKEIYLQTCNMLFETYSHLIPHLTRHFEERYPKDESSSPAAYAAATRAKVLDCLRGLLPASTLTNMGIFGNGRFFEQLLHKLHCNPLAEMQELGKLCYQELFQVIPSFIRRSHPDHKTHQGYAQFDEKIHEALTKVAAEIPETESESPSAPVIRLIDSDPDSLYKVAAALLYSRSHQDLPSLVRYCKQIPEEQLHKILLAAADCRENRRHKSPRALEQSFFTFEILADFGVYRDLHRHRMLSQERQLLSCSHGYYTPAELLGTEGEAPYHEAMQQAKIAYDRMAKKFPEEAQYVVPMAYHVRWYFHVNLRALQWLCELRSAPAGHPTYRFVAQCMAKEVCQRFPAFACFFKFVDYAGYDLGRLSQEQRRVDKQLPLVIQ